MRSHAHQSGNQELCFFGKRPYKIISHSFVGKHTICKLKQGCVVKITLILDKNAAQKIYFGDSEELQK